MTEANVTSWKAKRTLVGPVTIPPVGWGQTYRRTEHTLFVFCCAKFCCHSVAYRCRRFHCWEKAEHTGSPAGVAGLTMGVVQVKSDFLWPGDKLNQVLCPWIFQAKNHGRAIPFSRDLWDRRILSPALAVFFWPLWVSRPHALYTSSMKDSIQNPDHSI